MDLILKLPKALQSLSNQEVPPVVQERLNYLWNTSNNLALHSPALAHRLSRSFVVLSNKFDVDLPEYVSNRLCRHCCAIQVPSETCSVRLRTRSRKSNSNRLSEKPKNQIVYKCLMCDKVSNKVNVHSLSTDAEASLSGKKRSFGDVQVTSMASLSSSKNSPVPKFSFLNKNIGNSSSAKAGHSFGSSKVDNLDFISFKDNSSSSINNNGDKNGGLTKNKSSSGGGGGLFTSQLLKSLSGSNLSGMAANKSKTSFAQSSGKLSASQSNTSISSMASLFNMTRAPAPVLPGVMLDYGNKKKKQKKI